MRHQIKFRHPFVQSSIALHALALAPALCLSTIVFFGPILTGPSDLPGDLGDARFNIYVLEHLYRWLRGLDPSLVSPQMFYPYPYTLGLSDNHAGSALAYAAFRAAGLDAYQAFKGWFVVGYLGTFFATYYVLSRLLVMPLVAAMGAFLFAFSLPVLAQIGHAQLTYRLAVPFAFFYAVRFTRTWNLNEFYKLAAACSAQCLFSIYLGIFTSVYCLLLMCAWFVSQRRWPDFRKMLSEYRPRTYPMTAFLLLGTASATSLAFHFYTSLYYQAQAKWPWGAIYTMVPRLQSYLMMDALPYWSGISAALPDVPARHEHQLFLGLPTLILFLIATLCLFWRVKGSFFKSQGLMAVMAGTAGLAILLFLAMGPVTLYRALGILPGLGAIRAVSRHMTVGAFPFVVTGCLFLIALHAQHRWRPIAAFLSMLVFGWHGYDLWASAKSTFSSADARDRIATLVRDIKTHGDYDSGMVLAYLGTPQNSWVVNQIDSMFAAQALGIPTLNGYAGLLVPGYDPVASCAGMVRHLAIYRGWAESHGQPTMDSLWRTPLVVPQSSCELDRSTVSRASVTAGPGLSRQAARAVRLSIVTRELWADGWRYVIRVSNNSSERIHAMGPNPFRLSWRREKSSAWDTRVGIPLDIEPGHHGDVIVVLYNLARLPPPHVVFTFVSERAFWGHDVGVPPISSEQENEN